MKVLIAVDERVFGRAIADFVASHQWPAYSQFQIVHVIESLSPVVKLALSAEQMENLKEERLRLGRSLVLEIGSRVLEKHPDASVDQVVYENGTAKETILRTAKDWQPDLIVMGSHSRHGLERLFLGSVSLAVLTQAPCTVVIVRLPHESKTEAETESEQILSLPG